MKRTLRSATIVAVAIVLCGCNQATDSTQLGDSGTADTQPEDANLESKANGIVDMLSRQDFAGVAGNFDATMRSALPESALRDTWNSLTQQAGAFQNRGSARTASEQGFDVVYVECMFERAKLNAKVVFNKSGEVSGLFLQKA
jgi:PBP1b-binding outer membrane lipoprotein LpoB